MTDPQSSTDRIGRFVVLEPAGSGAMGDVYAAYDPELDRRVAVKLVRGAHRPTDRTRFRREAHAMARVSHPNVVQVYEVGEHEGQLFIAMEYLPGGTLRAWQTAEARAWPDVIACYLDAGAGLAAAHRAGLVHRDFKPGNVLLDGDGRPQVIDFGLAHGRSASDETDAADADPSRATDDILEATVTRHGDLVGTPAYMAPEQLDGHPAGPAADQFAFCVALFEALYGVPPYNRTSMPARRLAIARGHIAEAPAGSRVPAAIGAAIRRGLAMDPADRWPSMDACLAALGWRDPLERAEGWQARMGWFAIAALAVWVVSVVGPVLVALDVIAVEQLDLLVFGPGNIVILLWLWRIRGRWGSRAYGRQLMAWLVSIIVVPWITWAFGEAHALDFEGQMALDLLTCGSLCALAGFAFAPWMLPSALVFYAGAWVVSDPDEIRFVVYATAYGLALGIGVLGSWFEARFAGRAPTLGAAVGEAWRTWRSGS